LAYIRSPLRKVGVKVELKPQHLIWNISGRWVDCANLEQFFKDLSEIFFEEKEGLRMLYEKEIQPVEKIVATFMTDMDGVGLVGKVVGTIRIISAMRTMQKSKPLQENEGNIFRKYLDPDGRALAFLVEREDEVDYRGEMSFFTKIMKMYSQSFNIYPANGYQNLADNMAETFRAYGGDLRTSVDVEKIIIDGDRAIGVEAKGHQHKETVYAHSIISCIDLKKAFHQLIGDAILDKNILERLEKSKLSRAIPILYLGVDISPEKIKKYFQGYEEVWYFPEIAPDPNDEHFYRNHSMVIHASCFHNPAHSPTGKTNLQIYLSCPPDGWMENWGLANGHPTERYRKIKEMVIVDLISALEKLIPDLCDHSRIEVCELGTPFTLERYTGNTEGSCLGFRMDADYINSNKFGTYFKCYPKIANLYFAGQQTGYPGGVLVALQSGQLVGKLA